MKIALHCPGLDAKGCGAAIAIDVPSMFGLSLEGLDRRLKASRWGLAARAPVGGESILDPMCPTCIAALADRIVQSADGRGDATPLAYLRALAQGK